MVHKSFLQLMHKDLRQFRRIYRGKLLDSCFLLFTNLIVFGYFMPLMGVSNTYGGFILIGAIASFGLFDTIAQVGEILFDIEGEQKITFVLSMPIPTWLVFCQIAVKWAVNNLLLCTPLIFFGKLLLWNSFSLARIDYFRFILIFLTISLFFGFFNLWLIGVIRRIQNLSSLFTRVVNPLFMLGGYFYTWQTCFSFSPIAGYLVLFNPMTYVMEGIRAAALGQKGYLPFWTCFLALWGFIIVLGTHGIIRLKKRLDCV